MPVFHKMDGMIFVLDTVDKIWLEIGYFYHKLYGSR